MDTLASLALATDSPVRDAMITRKPMPKDEYIVTQYMWKHIFGQAFLQMIILLPLIFIGEQIIPEDGGGTVENGRLYNFDGSENYIKKVNETPSRHFTIIFNTFVMMQLFNEINSRKISEEWNIFNGL
jgi:Ca2+ transporting ATPase